MLNYLERVLAIGEVQLHAREVRVSKQLLDVDEARKVLVFLVLLIQLLDLSFELRDMRLKPTVRHVVLGSEAVERLDELKPTKRVILEDFLASLQHRQQVMRLLLFQFLYLCLQIVQLLLEACFHGVALFDRFL